MGGSSGVSRARKLSGQLALSMLGDLGGPGVRKRLCPCEFGVSGRAMGSAGLSGETRWVLIAVLLVAVLARSEGARAPEGLPAGPGPPGHPQSAQPPPPGPRAPPGLETELGAQVRWPGAWVLGGELCWFWGVPQWRRESLRAGIPGTRDLPGCCVVSPRSGRGGDSSYELLRAPWGWGVSALKMASASLLSPASHQDISISTLTCPDGLSPPAVSAPCDTFAHLPPHP